MRPRPKLTDPCSVPDCGRVARRRGLCATHYERLLRYGDVRPDDPIREECEGPAQPCSCADPKPYVVHLFSDVMGEMSEYRPGCAVACKRCFRPIAEYMAVSA
jgi:hypothetical protein